MDGRLVGHQGAEEFGEGRHADMIGAAGSVASRARHHGAGSRANRRYIMQTSQLVKSRHECASMTVTSAAVVH